MKKSILIFAALFVASVSNAQITLLHTFQGMAYVTANIHFGNTYSPNYGYIESPYFYSFTGSGNGEITINLYNKNDFSLYKSIHVVPEINSYNHVCLVSRNLLTTDGKVCFCLRGYNKPSSIYNEDGQLIATINGDSPIITQIDGQYFLISTDGETYIYSLPGNGTPSAVNEVSAPRNNARKYLQKDQVFIESNDKTYTIQGQAVR